jgi:hypothetical protein
MATSQRLRLRDLRRLYQLLGECCELGTDPVAWQQHVVEQLPVLFGGQVGQYGEYRVIAPPFREPFWLEVLSMTDGGWATPSDRKVLEDHLATGRPEDGPHITPDLLDRRLRTLTWSEIQGRCAWLGSEFFKLYVRGGHLDDGLFAHHRIAPGHFRWMFTIRALGDRPFDQRERRLMAHFNRELALLWGTRLAGSDQPSVAELPRRLRHVLVCLLEGDSEKQAARKLGISSHTVHDYVKQLHARFGARSRGELLSRCHGYWPVLQNLAMNRAACGGISAGGERVIVCSPPEQGNGKASCL